MTDLLQWLFIAALIVASLLSWLTRLDDKWDLLRPRYGRLTQGVPHPKAPPKRKVGRRRGTR